MKLIAERFPEKMKLALKKRRYRKRASLKIEYRVSQVEGAWNCGARCLCFQTKLRYRQQDLEFWCNGSPKKGYLPVFGHSTDRETTKPSRGDIVRVVLEFKSILKKLVWREFTARESFEATDARHNRCCAASQPSGQRDLVLNL